MKPEDFKARMQKDLGPLPSDPTKAKAQAQWYLRHLQGLKADAQHRKAILANPLSDGEVQAFWSNLKPE